MKAMLFNSGQYYLFILQTSLIFLLIGLTTNTLAARKPLDITFYEHEHLRGASVKVSILPGECLNLKQGRTFSSAKFSDLSACVILYNADNCKQRPVTFKNGTSYGVDRFANVGANDDIASVKLCPEKKT